MATTKATTAAKSQQTTKSQPMLTAYAVAKLANKALEAEGLQTIKPQMVYNYVKNNLIPSTNGKITQADADKWVAKYVARKKARATA